MKNPTKKTLKPDMEKLVVQDLQKTGKNLLLVLDRDTGTALTATGSTKSELIAAINVNLRILAAVNEVLVYYGDAGVFAGEL